MRDARSSLTRLAYGASQGLRVSAYLAQKLLAARMSQPVPAPPELKGRMPDMGRVLRDLRDLLAQDLRNIELGYYELPADLVEGPIDALAKARRFFADLRAVDARRQARDNSEVFRAKRGSPYPRYYLQNFHYQTDGYLSEESAALYDHQVEVLFSGGADAMRRQALVPLKGELERRGLAGARLADIACGTGRFLREVKHNYPRLDVAAIDLSPYYLGEARRLLADWSGVSFIEAAAEAIPVADASFTVATSIYLFHELPAAVRRRVAAEMARVLAPDGLLILVDSLQLGDVPDYDALVEHFPAAFHEPYYANYARDDLPALFAEAGLVHEATTLAYFSKVMCFRKSVGGSS
jgi:ubiquinone/menaquinone biosynthesis C-methylase UbiE